MSEQSASEMDEEREGPLSLLMIPFWALFIAFSLRTFVFQPFTIPSASMEPNLIKGDHIITSKYSVGYGKYAASPLPFPVKEGRLLERGPKRGDIIVFKPGKKSKYFIKRVIGLPGDRIRIVSGVLYINGDATELTPTDLEGPSDALYKGTKIVLEMIPGESAYLTFNLTDNHVSDNTGEYIVPSGEYFMMGDNRDASSDSRQSIEQGGVGFVPAENIIGKAEFILLSSKPEFSLFKPWTWNKVRKGRFFKGLQ